MHSNVLVNRVLDVIFYHILYKFNIFQTYVFSYDSLRHHFDLNTNITYIWFDISMNSYVCL